MSHAHAHIPAAPLSETPPGPPVLWPPTPPGSEKRTIPAVRSVREVRDCWKERFPSSDPTSDAIDIPVDKSFDPTRHFNQLDFLRRVDCYPTFLRVRMPTTTHEVFVSGIEREFTAQQLTRQCLFLGVELCGSSPVVFQQDSGTKKESRQPDIQFSYAPQATPRVVIEVAYSQTEKALRHLAYDYIFKSNGKINRVYGIKLNPLSSGKSSTVTEWRAHVSPSTDAAYDEELRVKKTFCREFRAGDGSLANADECLTISLRDFDVQADGEDVPIRITFRSLFELYSKAEQRHDARKRHQEQVEQPAKRIKKFQPVSSSEDEPSSPDEAAVVAASKRQEKEAKEDGDFKPSSFETESSST